ncbi:hypothetical protein TARUN_7021 [Trichoderma arundinaceum]|uniref:Uncharacterized protein n=1 Tax=Trichoderma arundinaceum TaxID=490622 RepID=A0A395NH95_TRIAR|nr:hypothetical protein TARUN_7021 [Trichoderma arundinaceum]
MHNPNFSEYELAHSSTPSYAASEEGPQKWADDRDYKYSHKPRSSSRSVRSVTTESASSPSQEHSPYLSPGLDANSAAGRLRQVDQFGFSRSTDQISLESKAPLSGNRSASTKPWEARNYRQYHIPIRSEIPSPASNPKNTPTSSLMVPSLTSGDETPTAIGMALGSPSHHPGSVESLWQTQVLTTVTSEGHAPEPNSNSNGLSRSMSKRWNPFTRTKSKRTKPADKSTESLVSRAPGADSGKSLDLGSRANGAKNEEVPGLPNQRDLAVPTRNPPVPPQFQVHHPKQLQSLLNVEIPTIEMERYSIMFGNILQKQQPQYQYFLQQAQQSQLSQESQPQPQVQHIEKSQETQKPEKVHQAQPSHKPPPPPHSMELEKPQEPQHSQDALQPQQTQRPTLPVRRQVKLDRLKLPAAKDFQDGSIPVEIIVPRRSTSPLPNGSPSFSLFPQNQAPVNGLPPRLSSRARSNTSPAIVNFPTPAMFKGPAETRKRTTSVSTPSHDEPLPTDAQMTPERRERLVSKFHRKESPSEPNMPKAAEQLSESPASVPVPPMPRSILKKPTGPPPPPPSNREPVASSQQRAAPKQHQHQLSKASIRTDADEEEVEKALYEAVEISIARQISVSRQQRKMLVPLNRSASRKNPGEAAADVAAQINQSKNKRIAETRTATPVLIHPVKEANRGPGGYRKSSRVVLEGA